MCSIGFMDKLTKYIKRHGSSIVAKKLTELTGIPVNQNTVTNWMVRGVSQHQKLNFIDISDGEITIEDIRNRV